MTRFEREHATGKMKGRVYLIPRNICAFLIRSTRKKDINKVLTKFFACEHFSSSTNSITNISA